MTPAQFTAIRAKHFGEGDKGRVALQKAFGIGSRNTVYRYERGESAIPGPVERLMLLIDEDANREDRDRLVADLNEVLDNAIQNNYLVEGEFAYTQKEHGELQAERDLANSTVKAAIAHIEKGVRWW